VLSSTGRGVVQVAAYDERCVPGTVHHPHKTALQKNSIARLFRQLAMEPT
jgi:hypothetical protein